MPHIPHETLQDLIRDHLFSYYIERDMDTTLCYNDKRHYALASEVNQNYTKELQKDYPFWDTTEAREALSTLLDYLTGIFSKFKAEETKTERIQKAPIEIVHPKKHAKIISW